MVHPCSVTSLQWFYTSAVSPECRLFTKMRDETCLIFTYLYFSYNVLIYDLCYGKEHLITYLLLSFAVHSDTKNLLFLYISCSCCYLTVCFHFVTRRLHIVTSDLIGSKSAVKPKVLKTAERKTYIWKVFR